jgi:hypothetical protein
VTNSGPTPCLRTCHVSTSGNNARVHVHRTYSPVLSAEAVKILSPAVLQQHESTGAVCGLDIIPCAAPWIVLPFFCSAKGMGQRTPARLVLRHSCSVSRECKSQVMRDLIAVDAARVVPRCAGQEVAGHRTRADREGRDARQEACHKQARTSTPLPPGRNSA